MNIHIHHCSLPSQYCIFFFFLISGHIQQLMNFNRPQSEHLSSVFLSPKVMDLNHLRVLRQFCVCSAKQVRMKWGGEEAWMIRTDGKQMNKKARQWLVGGWERGLDFKMDSCWTWTHTALAVNSCMDALAGNLFEMLIVSWLPCSRTTSLN